MCLRFQQMLWLGKDEVRGVDVLLQVLGSYMAVLCKKS